MVKKIKKYLEKHPYYMALVAGVAGVGVGYLTAYPIAASHPIRWGVAMLLVAGALKVATLWM
jgi:hypothetical protein